MFVTRAMALQTQAQKKEDLLWRMSATVGVENDQHSVHRHFRNNTVTMPEKPSGKLRLKKYEQRLPHESQYPKSLFFKLYLNFRYSY